MKFTCSVIINRPIDKVVELFDKPENMKEWQDGFQSFEHLSGIPGSPGAKSKIVYQSGRRKIELIETVLVRNLPEEFSGKYEHKSMVNNMKNSFEYVGPNQTLWLADLEYTSFNGLMPKLMGLLFPSMFRKQTQKWLDQFKIFAESQG
jgi:hypothetical protein